MFSRPVPRSKLLPQTLLGPGKHPNQADKFHRRIHNQGHVLFPRVKPGTRTTANRLDDPLGRDGPAPFSMTVIRRGSVCLHAFAAPSRFFRKPDDMIGPRKHGTQPSGVRETGRTPGSVSRSSGWLAEECFFAVGIFGQGREWGGNCTVASIDQRACCSRLPIVVCLQCEKTISPVEFAGNSFH